MKDSTTRMPTVAAALVFGAALIARLPALRGWWCLDDWGQLAGAAGLVPPGGARWVSQHLYWVLMRPVGGLDPLVYAATRLLLHGLGAVAIVRIGRHAGLPPRGTVLAGLLFAAGPIAFTPLYWASGIQELLGGVLALVAVERWLAAGRTGVGLAAVAGVLSIFSKEAGYGLPILFALLLLTRSGPPRTSRRGAWVAVALLGVAAFVAGRLVLGHFARGAGDPYALGGPGHVLENLGKFGWWLGTPTPRFASRITWTVVGGGAALWLAWAGYAAFAWRRGQRLPAGALAAALLSLAPALPLVNQAHPYLAYSASAAGALTLATLLPRRGRLPVWTAVAAAVVAAAWGWWGMETRLANRTERGWPADPVARGCVVSRQAAAVIRGAAEAGPTGLVLLQPPLDAAQAARSRLDPAGAVTASARWTALGGDLGPRLLAGPAVPVRWTTGLADLQPGERVLCESAKELRDWGGPDTALFYAALLDLGLGHFDRATAHLQRAAALGADPDLFICDDTRSGARPLALRRLDAYAAWLAAETRATRLPPMSATTLLHTARTIATLRPAAGI